jgi:TP901 family phage tail tape measure protein
MVNIVVNTRHFNRGMRDVHSGLRGINGAAQFYLLRASFLAAAGTMTELIKKAAELEEGFIKIERVASQLKNTNFRAELIGLGKDTAGVTVQELQKVIKLAAQLGFRGKEDLVEFGKQIAILSSVTGEDSEALATSFGKLLQIFDMSPQKVSPLINSVLQLADDFNATEQQIVDITTRIGGIGVEAGLTVTEVAALATAMKSVEKSTEVSGTALANFIQRLNSRPTKFAEAVGLTKKDAEEWYKTLQENPIQGIISALNMIKTKNLREVAAIFKSLGIEGVRNSGAILKLAQNMDEVHRALNASNQGFSENVRLMQQQYDEARGLTAQIKDLGEAWDIFLAKLGNTGAAKGGLNFLTNSLNLAAQIMSEDFTRSKRDTKVDVTDINSVNNRINQLEGHERAFEKAIMAPKPLPSKAFNDFWTEVQRQYHNVFGGTQTKQEIDELKRIRAKLLNPNNEVVPPGKKRNIEGLPEDDEKKHKGRGPRFEGFMRLEEAWKNLLLDSIGDKGELKKLDAIHKEAVQQNVALNSIDETLKTRTFPAVVV